MKDKITIAHIVLAEVMKRIIQERTKELLKHFKDPTKVGSTSAFKVAFKKLTKLI